MKRITVTTLLLAFFVTLNLLLIYFLMFDTQILTPLFNRFEEETVITTTSEPRENGSNFRQLTNPTVDQIITPYKLVVKEDAQYYDVNYNATLEAVMELLANQPFELVDNHVVSDPEMFHSLSDQNLVELIYPTKFSVPALKRLIEIPTDLSTQFELNRIMIPEDEAATVYLVDTISETYIEANLQDADLKAELFTLIRSVRDDQWLAVEPYLLSQETVYLPTVETLASSQVYTLDELPDNLFLNEVFPNSNYDISEPDENNIRSYHTLLTSLLINDTTNFMTINHTFPSSSSSQNITRDMILSEERMRYSYPYIQSYEYWPGDIRLYQEQNNVVTYRRFLNGLPIYAAEGLADYGATRVTLRTNSTIEVFRFHMPLVVLGTHIHDMSEVYDVESAVQIETTLIDQGLSFADFDKIILGYEWQADMENFKKVTLIPKWFFYVNSQYYSIDQVRDGTVREYVDQQSTFGTNGANSTVKKASASFSKMESSNEINLLGQQVSATRRSRLWKEAP